MKEFKEWFEGNLSVSIQLISLASRELHWTVVTVWLNDSSFHSINFSSE